MGAYGRTDPTLDVFERIYETVEEVGTSITLTTLTSTLAFGLGCLASVPAVYWLCLYAVPTVAFVYAYQLTFFVAAITLDEKRVAENRKDAFMVCRQKVEPNSETEATANQNILDKFVDWYAEALLQPTVKVVVLVAFTALLGLCAWSASQLTQDFDVVDVLPSDSYVIDFLDAREDYTERSAIAPFAYFRDVDQSQAAVREEMVAYVDGLVAMETIPERPPSFWVESFEEFVQDNEDTLGQLVFNEQLNAFLDREEYKLVYAPHIIRDETTGNIITSRVRLFMDNVEIGNVNAVVDALEEQEDVAASQPKNQGRSDYAFFLYDDLFQIWGTFATSVSDRLYRQGSNEWFRSIRILCSVCR